MITRMDLIPPGRQEHEERWNKDPTYTHAIKFLSYDLLEAQGLAKNHPIVTAAWHTETGHQPNPNYPTL